MHDTITENFHVNASRMTTWTGSVACRKQSSAEDVVKVKLGKSYQTKSNKLLVKVHAGGIHSSQRSPCLYNIVSRLFEISYESLSAILNNTVSHLPVPAAARSKA